MPTISPGGAGLRVADVEYNASVGDHADDRGYPGQAAEAIDTESDAKAVGKAGEVAAAGAG